MLQFLLFTGYLINPSDVHAVLGTTAQFRCVYTHRKNESAPLVWRFNYDHSEATRVNPVVTTIHGSNQIDSTLIIEMISIEYHRLKLYCSVAVTETVSYRVVRTDRSETAVLYVQGDLLLSI